MVYIWKCEGQNEQTGKSAKPGLGIDVAVDIPGGNGMQPYGSGATKKCAVEADCECEQSGPSIFGHFCNNVEDSEEEVDPYTDTTSEGPLMLGCATLPGL
jgi:hypothetical protein